MNVSGIREISTHINHEDTLVFGTSKYNLPGIIKNTNGKRKL